MAVDSMSSERSSVVPSDRLPPPAPPPAVGARVLGLVSRVGDARAVLVVGRDRTGDQCGHQRNDAEHACSGDKWSAFHLTLKPLFMP